MERFSQRKSGSTEQQDGQDVIGKGGDKYGKRHEFSQKEIAPRL
jgi:hypothetical protein